MEALARIAEKFSPIAIGKQEEVIIVKYFVAGMDI